jgi:tRNA pseudouridine-54 N-methylase
MMIANKRLDLVKDLVSKDLATATDTRIDVRTDLIMMTEDHPQVIDAVTKTATDATEDRETITRRNFLTES